MTALSPAVRARLLGSGVELVRRLEERDVATFVPIVRRDVPDYAVEVFVSYQATKVASQARACSRDAKGLRG